MTDFPNRLASSIVECLDIAEAGLLSLRLCLALDAVRNGGGLSGFFPRFYLGLDVSSEAVLGGSFAEGHRCYLDGVVYAFSVSNAFLASTWSIIGITVIRG